VSCGISGRVSEETGLMTVLHVSGSERVGLIIRLQKAPCRELKDCLGQGPGKLRSA
jgi:hypothetical protein